MEINVNGKSIHPIENEANLINYMKGAPRGSILIIKHDCYYSWKTQLEAADRGIKIIRAD